MAYLSLVTRGAGNMDEISDEVTRHDSIYETGPSRVLLLILLFNIIAAVYDFADDGIDVSALIFSVLGAIGYFQMSCYETFLLDQLVPFFMCVEVTFSCAAVGASEPVQVAYSSLFGTIADNVDPIDESAFNFAANN